MTPPLPTSVESPPRPPSETATETGGSVQLAPSVLAQMVEMITQAMRGEMQQMKSGMDGNAQQMEKKWKEWKTKWKLTQTE